MIKIGNTEVKDVRLGSAQVAKVMQGDKLVWQKVVAPAAPVSIYSASDFEAGHWWAGDNAGQSGFIRVKNTKPLLAGKTYRIVIGDLAPYGVRNSVLMYGPGTSYWGTLSSNSDTVITLTQDVLIYMQDAVYMSSIDEIIQRFNVYLL